jgi:hypothetical protein
MTAIADPGDLQCRIGSQSVSQWARKNIGDSHKEKRKTCAMRSKRQSKRLKGKSVRSDATTDDKNNPTYKDSNDSSTRAPSDDSNNRDDTGGGTASLAAHRGGYERPLSPFTAYQFTHCIHDPNHGAPTSPRIPASEANARVDSSGPSS